jgi:hypothetical protein
MSLKPDRARILKTWKPDEGVLLDELPLIYQSWDSTKFGHELFGRLTTLQRAQSSAESAW